jgi:phosphoribosylformimino-5-aminoimidazole carboxamide ribotide isomerase
MTMESKIIPVLDVLKGQVVRGVAGRREEYRPIVSRLTASTAPGDVAHALHDEFGFSLFYLADLDAILGQPAAIALYEELHAAHFRLWVDAGLRQAADAAPLRAAGVEGIVAGLETLAGPNVLRELLLEFGPERLLFSVDLKGGVPLGRAEAWPAADAVTLAGLAVALGVRRLIFLDLARVGMGQGTGTENACAELVDRYPGIEVIAGGGVRDRSDLERLRQCGVSGVLVASALHDGRLTSDKLLGL